MVVLPGEDAGEGNRLENVERGRGEGASEVSTSEVTVETTFQGRRWGALLRTFTELTTQQEVPLALTPPNRKWLLAPNAASGGTVWHCRPA